MKSLTLILILTGLFLFTYTWPASAQTDRDLSVLGTDYAEVGQENLYKIERRKCVYRWDAKFGVRTNKLRKITVGPPPAASPAERKAYIDECLRSFGWYR